MAWRRHLAALAPRRVKVDHGRPAVGERRRQRGRLRFHLGEQGDRVDAQQARALREEERGGDERRGHGEAEVDAPRSARRQVDLPRIGRGSNTWLGLRLG